MFTGPGTSRPERMGNTVRNTFEIMLPIGTPIDAKRDMSRPPHTEIRRDDIRARAGCIRGRGIGERIGRRRRAASHRNSVMRPAIVGQISPHIHGAIRGVREAVKREGESNGVKFLDHHVFVARRDEHGRRGAELIRRPADDELIRPPGIHDRAKAPEQVVFPPLLRTSREANPDAEDRRTHDGPETSKLVIHKLVLVCWFLLCDFFRIPGRCDFHAGVEREPFRFQDALCRRQIAVVVRHQFGGGRYRG